MCLKIPIRANLFDGKRGKLGSNRTIKLSKGTWHHIKIRERKGPSRGIIQKCEPHECNPCAPRFEERVQDETLQQERCTRRVAWDLSTSSKIRIRQLSTLLLKPGQCRHPLQNLQRNENSRLTPEHQCTVEQKGFEFSRTGDSAEIQEPHNGGNGQWRSANKRGSTSFRSRSCSLRDCAITR